ncbi:MAG: peptidase MA family metallohydrolase [Syntrophales bacterium]|nr:peptidase MA family metallohydrolase [Syntrophales bacterium]
MKLGRLTLGLVCLISILWFPNPVHAENQLNIITNSAEARFPMAIDFQLKVINSVPINDVRLRYTIAAFTLAKVTSESFVKVVPGTAIDAEWTMDMRRTGGLPPGTKITYWWLLTDKNGTVTKTDPIMMQYDDPRHKWRSATDGSVTLLWYSGDNQMIKEFQQIAKDSIAKMGGETGLTLDYPINIYMYSSYDELKGAMVFPQDWIGAVSYTDLQTIILGVPTSSLEYAKLSLRHELSHQVTRQLTHSPYCTMPVWLSEGLAVYAQGDGSYSGMGTLKEAENRHTLISARSLCSPFPADSALARQSYAESLGIVSFLIDTYGQAKMLDFLAEFKKGSTYNDALKKVYNLDIDSLDIEWQKYLFSKIG